MRCEVLLGGATLRTPDRSLKDRHDTSAGAWSQRLGPPASRTIDLTSRVPVSGNG